MNDIDITLVERGNSKQRILLIDDELANIQTLTEILEEHYEIVSASNGEAGITMAIEQQIDLILLDIQMPGMDGYEVCRILKRKETTREIPVIFVTAMFDSANEAKGLDLGAIDYIVKPFSLHIIKARVRNHMELEMHRKTLKVLSFTDELTGLPNRRQLDLILAREWHRAHRQQLTLSILLIDIDHFKKYNDHYGHQTGDHCLKRFAQTIDRCRMRMTDFIARYGGEEFVAILPETDCHGALNMASRILKAVEAEKMPHILNENDKIITASIGVSTAIPSTGTTAEQLLNKADQALYRAKSAGRNRAFFIAEPERFEPK